MRQTVNNLLAQKVMMLVKIPKVERETERKKERETLANACVLLLWRRIIYWPIIWVKALRGVAQILFCFFHFCLAEHKQCGCCKIKWLVSRDRLVPYVFCFFFSPSLFLKGRLLTWYLSFCRFFIFLLPRTSPISFLFINHAWDRGDKTKVSDASRRGTLINTAARTPLHTQDSLTL